jgi:hypothetical protein
MNQDAINEFKAKTSNLVDILQLFQRWIDETAAQDKLYESKMHAISDQNKVVEDKHNQNQIKEQDLIRRELSVEDHDRQNRKKQEELLLREIRANQDRQELTTERMNFEKERKVFESMKIHEEELLKLKLQIDEKERNLRAKEQLLTKNEELNDERSRNIKVKEEQLEKRGAYLNNILK